VIFGVPAEVNLLRRNIRRPFVVTGLARGKIGVYLGPTISQYVPFHTGL
jgi:hypothetical protein